jgi:hypothetical protein
MTDPMAQQATVINQKMCRQKFSKTEKFYKKRIA